MFLSHQEEKGRRERKVRSYARENLFKQIVQGKGFSWVSAFLANQYHHPYIAVAMPKVTQPNESERERV